MSDGTATHGPVLAGVEESSYQQDVVRYAARQAQLHRRSLHLLNVVDSRDGSGADRDETASGASRMESLAALVRQEFPDVPSSVEGVAGRPSEVLLDRSAKASLLVLGHRGSGGFARLPLGSVSLQVATHADCPVLVVRPGERSEVPEQRVVTGVDISDVSEAALDLAYAEAALRGARLELVHGSFHFSEVPIGPGMAAPDFEALDELARRVLEAEADKRRDRFPEVRTDIRVERVRPSTVLTEASRRASLMVVGSHGRTGLRRLMLGSVSAETLHSAACPVLVVPPSDQD
ncbi:Universal stress protein [Streptomyces sp. YIM 130001]|uniref:universal stress protein n=1 Tax=Streptomyces sp. YIM 130001 TaxID=2259644 RepID=UPI000E652C7C|nr:universal stress protein [Streptomyces sp. YIM 130001]RII09259.1 Universal stress protein [Streptomyces sp. YIM 130001]